MAATPQGQRKALPVFLARLGAFLLVVAIIIPAYSIPRFTTTPLAMGDNNRGIIKESKEFRGTALDIGAYLHKKPSKQNKDRPECAGGTTPMSCYIDTNVPMKTRTTLFGADPADRHINTFQAGYLLWRTDKKDAEQGLLASYIDRVTTDRKTAEPVDTSIVYFNADPGNAGANDPTKPFTRHGFQYKLPYNLRMDGKYDYFDVYALKSAPLTPVREVTIDGVDAIEFTQVVGPINLHKTLQKGLKDPKGKLSAIDDISLKTTRFTLPANLWDPSKSSAVTTYDAYYYTERTIVASTTTGRILKERERSQNFVATDDKSAAAYIANGGMDKGFKDPTVTLLSMDAVSSPDTVADAVAREKSEATRLVVLKVVAALAGIAGIALIVGGWVLIVRRRKAEQAAIDAITYDDPSLSDDVAAAPFAE